MPRKIIYDGTKECCGDKNCLQILEEKNDDGSVKIVIKDSNSREEIATTPESFKTFLQQVKAQTFRL